MDIGTNNQRKKIPTIIYQILAIIFLIGSALMGIHYIKTYLTDPEFTQLTQWFLILILMNILVMGFIFYSYAKIKFKPGLIGPRGYMGPSGKPGPIDTCAVCEKEVPVLEQKYDSVIIQDPVLPDDLDSDPDGTVAKIWEYPDRKGKLRYLSLGKYRKLGTRFQYNLSSVEVKDGYQIVLYSEEDFKGIKEVLPSGYYPNLDDSSELKNKVRSISIEIAKDQYAVVSFWEQSNRSGNLLELTVGKYPGIETKYQNQISSIKVPKGYQVFLYRGINFGGRRLVLFDGYYPDLRKINGGFDNQISSIIIKKGPPIPKGVVKMWEHPHRKGRRMDFGIGWHEYVGKKMNDRISCIEVPKGHKVTVYKTSYFRGRKEVYRAGYYWYIKKFGSKFNDNISSVIVEYDL